MRLLTTVAPRPSSLVTPSFRDAPAGTRGHAGPKDRDRAPNRPQTPALTALCLAGMFACACGRVGLGVRAGHGLSGTTHSGMSQDVGNTRTLKVRVLLFLGLVRAAGVEGEFSPYEGTAAKDCGWNLGERLHSVVVGRVDLADEAAAAKDTTPQLLVVYQLLPPVK
jgi:hypothetical protein